jgi:hypothetical protein
MLQQFPVRAKEPVMSLAGPLRPTAEAASCPQLVEGDILALSAEAGFDPELTLAVQLFCAAKLLFDHLVGAHQNRLRHR